MRSDAKASSAGSTTGQGASLGSFVRGAFAIRGASGEADGSGALAGRGAKARLLCLLGAVIAAAMAFAAAPALAITSHPFTGVTIGPVGTGPGSNGEEAGFKTVQAVTVDQSNGDVYVYDAPAGKIYKFDSAGQPVNFSALGSNHISGVGGAGGGEEELAIAPPGSPGGTAGDIYVAAGFEVKIYSPAGNFLGELTGGEYCGVATDPSGHVFVGAYPNQITEYTPSANPVVSGDLTAESSPSAELPEICNVAVDGIGHVYGAHYFGESFVQLDGIEDPTVTPFGAASTLAIDPATNDVYANRKDSVVQYDSSGAKIGTFAAAQIVGESHGVAVDGTSGKVYVGGAGDRVAIFGPETVLAGVNAESPSGVGGTKATLNGAVNPDNVAVTECRFEYGTTGGYGSTVPCEGALPTDGSDHPVTAALTGLTPGVTYHWRLVAVNANGANETADGTFETKVPAVTGKASAVKAFKATLNGIVKPEGEAVTECRFEYGLGLGYGQTVPCAGAIPTDEAEHPVTASIGGLNSGALYHFRLVIVRGGGKIPGADERFETTRPAETGPPVEPVTLPTETVTGTVNPEGASLTECTFKFGTTGSYGQSVPCTESLPSIGAGEAPVTVHGSLGGLLPGTTYHYRLFAATAEGTSEALGERTFLTPGAVVETRAIAVGGSQASIETHINPKGSPTEYHLEYGTSAAYGTSTPDVFVGEDSTNHKLKDVLSDLTPGTVYHFRVVATNTVGSSSVDQTFTTRSPFSPQSDCPNQEFRGGLGANLPDCRAYEQVSPTEKHGGFIKRSEAVVQASSSGNRITFTHLAGLETSGGSASPPPYVGSRGADGWSTNGAGPLADPGRGFEAGGWGEDLLGVVSKRQGASGTELVVYDTTTGGYRPLWETETRRFFPSFGGFTPDSSVFVFDEEFAAVAEGAVPNRNNAYEFRNGTVKVVARIPVGAAASCDDQTGPACVFAPKGSFIGPYNWASNNTEKYGGAVQYYLDNAISRDGRKVFFSAAGSGQLYLREDGVRTTRISASQASTPDPNGPKPAAFVGATPDGSTVYFISCEKLTDDSTAVSGPSATCPSQPVFGQPTPEAGQDLYAFDTGSGELTDLTVDSHHSDPYGAGVIGFLGASDDGSYVYFAAEGALVPGVTPNRCQATNGTAEHVCNIYVSHNGSTSLVATVGQENEIWLSMVPNGNGEKRKSRVGSDGTLVFRSLRNLTGYETAPSGGGGCGGVQGGAFSCAQIYRFDPSGDGLSCVSCDPTGAAPTGSVQLVEAGNDGSTSVKTIFRSHNVTADGDRVFFDSPDPLVAADTNGVYDPYEWEAEGAGSCTAATANASGGCLYLLSSGTSPDPSFFADASASGNDAFIFTTQQLTGSDKDDLTDVYDVRVGGGLASQNLAAGAPPCLGEACKGASSAPAADSSPGTSTFSGPGNQHEKPVKKCNKKCRKHKKHAKHKKSRGAHTNRGGSK